MSGAILQGVPMDTLDTVLWIDLPERQYIRFLTLAQKVGGTIIALPGPDIVTNPNDSEPGKRTLDQFVL